ncbi:sugar phosphate isomerase/epimerase family protein [Nocardioides sp. B-3]|uniref:sugar phosphate isomerase/epimerase family protein n=1 Tax=Nocardioides sp. B-3 TaxID=2895565 RepID=UPI00300E5D66
MDTVVGFTGSSTRQYVAMFPPVPASVIDDGYRDFADRWNPILDVFDECGVRFAHEVHPSEIAYDFWSTQRTLEAIGHRPAFGLNWDPSHMIWQGLDPVAFITDFADRIYHVDCKDTRMRMGGGRNGILSSHLPRGDQHRGWDFVSTGRGDVPREDAFRALARIGYDGPISVEWEDAGMDRLRGAPEALEFLRRFDFDLPAASFDAAFDPGLSLSPARERRWLSSEAARERRWLSSEAARGRACRYQGNRPLSVPPVTVRTWRS